MLITVKENMNWKDKCWDKYFVLLVGYSEKFDVSLESMDTDKENNKYSHTFSDNVTISMIVAAKGFFIETSSDSNLDDIREKIDFIYSHKLEADKKVFDLKFD